MYLTKLIVIFYIPIKFYSSFIYKLSLIYKYFVQFQKFTNQNISGVTLNIRGLKSSQVNYSLTYSVGYMVSINNYFGLDRSSIHSGFLQWYAQLVTVITEPMELPNMVYIN